MKQLLVMVMAIALVIGGCGKTDLKKRHQVQRQRQLLHLHPSGTPTKRPKQRKPIRKQKRQQQKQAQQRALTLQKISKFRQPISRPLKVLPRPPHQKSVSLALPC